MPSVRADTQVLALPCKAHHTFFRDTSTAADHRGLGTALFPDVRHAFLERLFRPTAPAPPSYAHPWNPLPCSQSACGSRSFQAVLPSAEPTGLVGTVPHWGPAEPWNRQCRPAALSFGSTMAGFPSQLPIFRLFQPKPGQPTSCHSNPRFSKKCPSLFFDGRLVSELL